MPKMLIGSSQNLGIVTSTKEREHTEETYRLDGCLLFVFSFLSALNDVPALLLSTSPKLCIEKPPMIAHCHFGTLHCRNVK